MNAVFREEDEVPVVSNDAINAQLASLGAGLRKVEASQSSIHARIDKTNERIDAVHTGLSADIKAVNTSLSDRIDKTNERIDAVHASLSADIKAVDAKLSADIKAVNTSLSADIKAVGAKIDRMGERMDAFKDDVLARFDKQSEQIKALDKRLDWIYISVKVVLAILGLCVSAAVIVNALNAVGWI